jgi:hypothetical protein
LHVCPVSKLANAILKRLLGSISGGAISFVYGDSGAKYNYKANLASLMDWMESEIRNDPCPETGKGFTCIPYPVENVDLQFRVAFSAMQVERKLHIEV